MNRLWTALMKRSDDEKLSAMLTALGQPNRLAVFRILAGDPARSWRANDIAERLDMTYTTAHYHLTRLADAGLAEATEGRGNGYHMRADVLDKLRFDGAVPA